MGERESVGKEDIPIRAEMAVAAAVAAEMGVKVSGEGVGVK
jgi:hypothetical protein